MKKPRIWRSTGYWPGKWMLLFYLSECRPVFRSFRRFEDAVSFMHFKGLGGVSK